MADQTIIFISDSNNSAGRYSAQQRDMLLSLPGITSKNVNFLLDGFTNMNELVKASKDKLRSVLNDKSEADTLYDFLNREIKSSSSFKPNTKKKTGGYQKWKEEKNKK